MLAVAIFLGAWLIVSGTLTITGAFAARRLLPDWWLLLILGCSRSRSACSRSPPPGDAGRAHHRGRHLGHRVGVMRIVIAFELKRLPKDVDEAFAAQGNDTVQQNGAPQRRVLLGQS